MNVLRNHITKAFNECEDKTIRKLLEMQALTILEIDTHITETERVNQCRHTLDTIDQMLRMSFRYYKTYVNNEI